MKKIITLLMLALPFCTVYSQDAVTVCHTPPTEKFAMFASNKDFNAKHPNPGSYVHMSDVGKMIQFKTPDGKEANAYFIPAKTKSDNWLLVFQEWWGLNDYVKRDAERFANDLGNVNVLALDMYDGKIATDRDAAGKYMQEFKQERGNSIVQGALTYAGKNAKIGTVGWCFGGANPCRQH
jgi:carboxymethylenebutenolidase